MKWSSSVPIAFAAVALLGLGISAQQPNNAANEEFARRQYDSGMSFLQNRRYAEALKDLQAVLDSFANSSVADNALLQIAQYQLDVAKNLTASQAAIDRLLKEYPDTDSAPMAHVLAGRVALAKGRATTDVDAAMASFERVLRLFPGSDAVPAAGYYSGEAMRLARRIDEAADRYRRVTMEYPRSPWAARAALGLGYCLVQQDRATSALQEIQWVRQQFAGAPVANDALNLNTIIYRLYVRPPAQPPFSFNGRFIGNERAEYRDVMHIQLDPDGRVFLGHKGGVAVFDAQGAAGASMTSTDASAFFVDEKSRIVVAREGSLIADKGETITILVPQRDGVPKPLEEIPAALITPKGERLVIDGKAKNVIRVAPDGKYLGVFSTTPATKLAINSLDDVAMLDKNTKSVQIVDRDGKSISRVLSKGTGYELDDPVDIAYDDLGHLYVLDRGRGSVLVFGAKNRLVTTLTIPEKSAGSFMRADAFGLDAAGRMYIFDERAKRIQVYQ